MPNPVGVPTLQVANRAQWRAWLQHNSATADEVWLLLQHIASANPGVVGREATEEALCFGWIDSTARSHDAESWWQRFTPRRPGSGWSKLNRQLVEQLTAKGLMTARGHATVDVAKHTGTWAMLADAQNGIVPDDLRKQLDADETAATRYETLPRSKQQAILEWIARAKRPETRQHRITRTIDGDLPRLTS